MRTKALNFVKKYFPRFLVIAIVTFVVLLAVPGVRADINFGQETASDGGPASPSQGGPATTNLSEKLPSSNEFVTDLTKGTKDAIRSPLGTRVISILKDLGRLFVWALEQMLELFKILINKI